MANFRLELADSVTFAGGIVEDLWVESEMHSGRYESLKALEKNTRIG